MAIIGNNSNYKWDFENIGGTTRVKITTGEDIAHLDELDPKMWTVLSCPVKGLGIDEKSLAYMDCDGDGKLRINDVICTSKWITSALKNTDLLLEGKDSIALDQINQEDACGKKLYAAAKQILENLGKDSTCISLADTADIAAIFAKTRFNGDGVIIEDSSDDAEIKAAGVELAYEVGTMMEIPRACLTADEIAGTADFFCFGTNDLTQMTYGFSRDDAGKFLEAYYDTKIFENDPFAKLDQTGVGKLMEMAIKLGKPVNEHLHVGICGEHGGDPTSVEFCHKIGLDYVSCSPFRVPIARLAAAQAAINNK